MLALSSNLQVEAHQATPTRDGGSSRKALLIIWFGFGCFALGAASTFLLLPTASQEPAHHVLAVAAGDMTFNPPMVVPSRPNPATDHKSKTQASLLPRTRGTSIVANAEPSPQAGGGGNTPDPAVAALATLLALSFTAAAFISFFVLVFRAP